MTKIGQKIRQLRQEGGLTQQDIAKHIMLSNVYISLIESGVTVPSASIIKRFANFYGVQHGTLIDIAKKDKLEKERLRIERDYE